MTHIRTVLALAVLTVPLTIVAQTQRPSFTPVTDAMLQKPDPAHWLMWRRTLDSWGFSPLDQVKRSNVNQLRMVWSRGMGPGNVQEATPLVYNGVMYVPNPNDYISALEAGTGRMSCRRSMERPEK
jgi:glucose dehydrogenase